MYESAGKILSDESGSVIIAAILILVTLTIMGIWASNTTITEYQIASNDQFHKIAFTNADSGVYVVPKVISRTVNLSEEQDSSDFNNFELDCINDSTSDLFREIMGYDDHDDASDIGFSAGSYNDTVEVDIERSAQENVEGGGVEFGSGAEGVGVGSTGGVRIVYTLDSFGTGPRNSESNVRADYRKVVGVAGGL